MNQITSAFVLGLGNMINPCVLPLYPAFLAYLAGRAGATNANGTPRSVWWLGLVVLAGVLTIMLAIGLLIAILQVSVGSVLGLMLPIVYLIVLGMGVLLFIDRNPFARLPGIHVPRLANPIANAYLYGMFYGPMTLPCSGPLVVGVFAYGVTDTTSLLSSIGYFLAFGLGFGLPLVVLPLLGEPFRKAIMRWMLARHVLLSRLSGLLLIAIGIYGFVQDWDLIRAYWHLP